MVDKTKEPKEVRRMLPGEAAVDRRLLDSVVKDILDQHIQIGLTYHLGLGRLLLEAFFNGDDQEYAKREKRHVSFRELAKRDDLPVSASTLYNAVAVTRQFNTLPLELASSLHMAHHRALLPLLRSR